MAEVVGSRRDASLVLGTLIKCELRVTENLLHYGEQLGKTWFRGIRCYQSIAIAYPKPSTISTLISILINCINEEYLSYNLFCLTHKILRESEEVRKKTLDTITGGPLLLIPPPPPPLCYFNL